MGVNGFECKAYSYTRYDINKHKKKNQYILRLNDIFIYCYFDNLIIYEKTSLTHNK